MNRWLETLKHDPIRPLLSSGMEPVIWFARRDLFGEDVGPMSRLWGSPGAQRIIFR